MTKATIAGLIAFINEQPADRHVSHASWACCAVGDYAASIGETVHDTRLGDFELLATDPVVKGLWNQAGTCSGPHR
jgi:hypothetical protein